MMRIGFFASHGGSSMKAIIGACQSEVLKDITPAMMISNNAGSQAIQWAKAQGLPAYHMNSKTHPDAAALCDAMLVALQDNNVTHIVLSGYMRLLDPKIIEAYKGRILNIHPSLLPKFGGHGMYGINVHEAVITAGEKESGATIHIVTEIYDEGPVVSQIKLPVEANDTAQSLQYRIASHETTLYIQTLKAIETGEVDLNAISNGKKSPIIFPIIL